LSALSNRKHSCCLASGPSHQRRTVAQGYPYRCRSGWLGVARKLLNSSGSDNGGLLPILGERQNRWQRTWTTATGEHEGLSGLITAPRQLPPLFGMRRQVRQGQAVGTGRAVRATSTVKASQTVMTLRTCIWNAIPH
jgi:hypothetical protein